MPLDLENVCVMFQKGVEEDRERLAQLLAEFSSGAGTSLPANFIQMTVDALRTNDWHHVGRAFVKREFVGAKGFFLLIGPYTLRRNGITSVALTGVYGEAMRVPPPPDFTLPMRDLFGRAAEIPQVIPFRCLAAFGHADREQGEAFLVPDAWGFPGSESGPALNNMTAQEQRFKSLGQARLGMIFSAASSELLIRSLSSGSIKAHLLRHKEFQFHEAGHATGITLQNKIIGGLLPTTWHGGVEEWRADGVEFELLSRMCSDEEAGQIIAANYCLRFGIDAHRGSDIEQDTDVIATILTFSSLLNSGSVHINDERKLCFTAESFDALVSTTRSHRQRALQLTRQEIELRDAPAVVNLYGSMRVDSTTRHLFEELVRQPWSGGTTR